jgi:hypothetical protein
MKFLPIGNPSIRAKTLTVPVPAATTGVLFTATTKLKPPVAFGNKAGNANLSIHASTGAVSAAAGITAGQEQTITFDVTGDDDCVQPWSLTLAAEAMAPLQVGTVTLTPGDGQLAAAWSAPSNGGSAITDYEIERRQPAGSGSYTTFSDGVSAATGATITGLANGTAAGIRVRAVNAVGPGPWSDEYSETPEVGGAGAMDNMLLLLVGTDIDDQIAAGAALGLRHSPNRAEAAAITTNIVGPCEVANNKNWAPNITGMTFVQNADHFAVTYDGTGADLFWPLSASCPAATTMTMQMEFDNQSGSPITLRFRRQNTGSGDAASSSGDIVVPTGVSTQSYTFANVLAASYYLQIEGQAGNAFTGLRVTKVGLFAAGSVQAWNTVNKHVHRLSNYSLDANQNIQTTDGQNTGANKAGIVTLAGSAQAYSAISMVAAIQFDTAQISSWNGYAPVVSSGNSGIIGDTSGTTNRPFHFRVTNGMIGLGANLFSKGITPIGAGWCIVGVVADATGQHVWINDMKGDRIATAWSGTNQFLELLGLLNNNADWTWPGKCQLLGVKNAKWTDSEWLDEVLPYAIDAITDAGNSFTDLPITAICAGDSIMEGTSLAGGFTRLASVTFQPTLQSYNMAVGGSSLGDWVSGGIYWNGLIAAVDAELDRRGYVAVVMRVGTNNIRNAGGGGVDGAALVTQLEGAFAALKARATLKSLSTDRVRIVASTIIPWGNEVGGTWTPSAQQITDLGEFNTAMRASTAYDGLMDVDANPVIGSSMIPYANTALFQTDRLHPSLAGHLAYMKEVKKGLRDALDDLLTPIDIIDSLYLTHGLNSSNSSGSPLNVPTGVVTTINICNVPDGATLAASASPPGMTFDGPNRQFTGTISTTGNTPITFTVSGTTARNEGQTFSRAIMGT